MDCKIVVNGNHRNRLEEALTRVQRRCKARTLDVRDIEKILDDVNSELQIPKRHLKGTKLYYSGAQHFPSSYRYIPWGTHFLARHNGRNWVVERIVRGICPNRRGNVALTLSESAKTAVVHCFDCFYV